MTDSPPTRTFHGCSTQGRIQLKTKYPYIFLCAKTYRSMTSGCRGTPYFGPKSTPSTVSRLLHGYAGQVGFDLVKGCSPSGTGVSGGTYPGLRDTSRMDICCDGGPRRPPGCSNAHLRTSCQCPLPRGRSQPDPVPGPSAGIPLRDAGGFNTRVRKRSTPHLY